MARQTNILFFAALVATASAVKMGIKQHDPLHDITEAEDHTIFSEAPSNIAQRIIAQAYVSTSTLADSLAKAMRPLLDLEKSASDYVYHEDSTEKKFEAESMLEEDADTVLATSMLEKDSDADKKTETKSKTDKKTEEKTNTQKTKVKVGKVVEAKKKEGKAPNPGSGLSHGNGDVVLGSVVTGTYLSEHSSICETGHCDWGNGRCEHCNHDCDHETKICPDSPHFAEIKATKVQEAGDLPKFEFYIR